MNITEGPENQYGRSRWQQHLFCKILKFLKLTRQTFSTEPGRALKLRPTFSSPGIPHHLLSPGGARCDVQLGMYSRSRQKKKSCSLLLGRTLYQPGGVFFYGKWQVFEFFLKNSTLFFISFLWIKGEQFFFKKALLARLVDNTILHKPCKFE